MCVTADGPEKVAILDVICLNDNVFLIVKGQRPEPYVFELLYNGIRAASRDDKHEVLELHRLELERVVRADASNG